MTQKRESQLEAMFQRKVRELGGIAVKLSPTHKGLPDRLVLLPGGRMHLVELKTDTGNLSPAQQVFHDRCLGMGIKVATLHGTGEITAWLRRVLWEPKKRKPGRPAKVQPETEQDYEKEKMA